MDRSKNEAPFFLFLGLVDTHAPFSGQPEELASVLRTGDFSVTPESHASHLPPRGEAIAIPPDHREQLVQYYAGVQMMDRQIGRLIKYLQSEDLLQNTLIIYTSDHGHMNGQHGLYGKGNATNPQNFFEENILVPLIMTWPKTILPTDTMISPPVSTCDIFQTILEVAQVELSQEQVREINSPGRSIISLLLDHPGNWSPYKYAEYGNARMISNDRYKYVQRMEPLIPGFGDEFYDLQQDPGENHNLFKHPSHQESIELLKQRLEKFFAQYQELRHSGDNLKQQPPANGNEIWR